MKIYCSDRRWRHGGSPKFTGRWQYGGLQESLEDAYGIFLSIEDWHEQVQINLGPNVEDIATECKPPRRGQFTFSYAEAHEDKKMALYW